MKIIFTLLCLALLALFVWFAPRSQNAQVLQSQSQEPLTVVQTDQDSPVQLTEEIKALLAALLREQDSRTGPQQKIDSKLLLGAKKRRNEVLAPAFASIRTNVDYDTQGRSEVDISGRITDNLVAAIIREGGEIVNSYPQFDALRARVQPERLEVIAALDEVRVIHRVIPPKTWGLKTESARPARASFKERAQSIQNQLLPVLQRFSPGAATPFALSHPLTGTVNTEGDVTHAANIARSTFGATGAGIKIGVISDSIRLLDRSRQNGELPNVTILSGRGGDDGSIPDTGEGTAMLEIIHDLAPGAQLFFSTGKGGQAAYKQNILDLAAAGCRIIVDDVEYPDELPFYDGPIAQGVNIVTAAGVLYFSAAGNGGNLNNLNPSVWEGDFFDAGPISNNGTLLGNAHRFAPDVILNKASLQTFQDTAFLSWSDTPGASTNDYNLFVFNDSGQIKDMSTNIQNGTQDPFEIVDILNGEHVVVVKRSGAQNRFLHVNVGSGRLSFGTAGRIKGHTAASNAISVAAVKAATSFPNAFVGGFLNPVETYSADGPRRIFYNENRTPITPGNFSSTGGTLRAKPDIAAASRIRTSVQGFETFPGTSAAAPHAAAIAALLLSFNPSLTAAQVRTAMTSTALDIEAFGNDRDSGAGIVMAHTALQSIATCPATPIVSGQPINGALITSDCVFVGTNRRVDVYQFHAIAGQQVVIGMSSSAIDTYLALLNPSNQVMVEDNNGAGGTNSRIPSFGGSITLPVTGTYTIWATSFFNGVTGAYSIGLTNTNCAFSLSPTSQVSISAASSGSFFVFATPPCPWIATSNVSWLTTNSSGVGNGIVNFAVAANTGASRTGMITVGGQSFTFFQSAGDAGGCAVTTITPGQTINTTLNTDCVFTGTSRFVDLFDFNGTAGQQIAIAMSSASFDTYLILGGPNGQIVAQNDDSSGSTNSRIPIDVGSFTLPLTGKYRIFATAFSPTGLTGSTGPYSLSLFNQATPSIQLGASSFSSSEGSGSVTVTVTRTGNVSGSSSVNIRTSDIAGLQSCTIANGRCSERCDYVTSLGTVTFNAGETSKTVTIPLIDDVLLEGPESFMVALSGTTGASLGSPSMASVTLTDNDFLAPASNPIDGVTFFIRQQYLDILNRQPDPTGLQNWINTLAPCPNGGFGEPPASNCDRLHVAAGFFQSDEFLNRGYWAFRFYMVSFNQRPSYAQFIPDMALVGGPKSPAEEQASKAAFAEAFVLRPEFTARYGSLTGQAFANALLQTAGLPIHTFTVTGGMTRGQILRGVVETTAATNRFLTEGTVSIQYFGFLRRDPDPTGYQNNVNTLNANPNNLRHMIFIFIYSTEYRGRFGPQ